MGMLPKEIGQLFGLHIDVNGWRNYGWRCGSAWGGGNRRGRLAQLMPVYNSRCPIRADEDDAGTDHSLNPTESHRIRHRQQDD